MQEIVIRIQGMTCGGCVASVRRVLGAVPGVAQAEVSLEKGEARVRFDPALADSAALKGAIEAAGFSAN
jgi:copper chaperone